MKHLQVYEGDWWDNDPNAPWNQDDREPDEYREIDQKESDLKFECVSLPEGSHIAILKAKPGVEPAGLWVVHLDNLENEYKLRLSWGDDVDDEYQIDDVAVVNYATDIYNDSKDSMSNEDWLDGESSLTPLSSAEVRDSVIQDLEYDLKPGYGMTTASYDKSRRDSIRMAIYMLDNLKYEDEAPY